MMTPVLTTNKALQVKGHETLITSSHRQTDRHDRKQYSTLLWRFAGMQGKHNKFET